MVFIMINQLSVSSLWLSNFHLHESKLIIIDLQALQLIDTVSDWAFIIIPRLR